jgi:hypothetical protein
MKNDVEAYKHGSFYEIFIHRAHKNYNTTKPGFHGSVIQNLCAVENGDTSFVRWHGSQEKQLEKAKSYMHKAMDKYLKMKKIPAENLRRLEELNHEIDRAYTTDDLMAIVYESLELTQILIH